MPSKYNDTTAVLQVIGCVYNNPSLLDITDKYIITDEDFVNEFHRTIFGAVYKLWESGAKKITLGALTDFFAVRPKSEALYKANKGDEWLVKISENAIPSTFDYYYNRLKKFSLLRAYDRCGIDVSDIYDPDNILDVKKRQAQEEFLDNNSLEKIADKIDGKIEQIKLQYIDNSFGEAYQAAEGIEALIENLKKHPEAGIPLYGPLINTVTKGARLGKFYLRSAQTGLGKAIPNYTMIPTPDGYRKVEDVRPGDYLFGQDGQLTKVIAIYPQPSQKEIWKVTFADGRVAECCSEHLWEYRYKTHKGYEYRVEDIQTIYERSLKLKNGLKNSNGRGYRFHIRMNQPVEYPEKKYHLSPYVMGALLGDGSFRYNDQSKSLKFSSADAEIPILIANFLGDKYYAKKNSEKNYNWTFRHEDNPAHPLWVEELLKDYPGLWNTKSEDKYIPEEYLYGSIDQRICLLQGLMDTDGSIDEKGRTSFTTISSRLRDNFIELCHSLGFCATYSIDVRNQYTTGECYNIHIQAPKSMKTRFFRLERKYLFAERYNQDNKREEYKDHLAIVNIEKTTQLADMTCFTVDNDDHLFLMNDYIVTHNTRSLVADACYFACDEIKDEQFGWIKTGKGQPTLFIATEQDLSEIQTLMLAFLSNVNEEHIISGMYEEGEEEDVAHAVKLLKDAPLYIETIPDFSLMDIENCIKKNIREHDVSYIVFDYLHTSMKILEEVTRRSGGVKLREDNVLFMLATKLKDICNQYHVFLISATQLNSNYVESETPDQNLLRGSKAIADRIDLGMIMLSVSDEDLIKLEPVLATGQFINPTIKISIYKNRRGKYKSVFLWCAADLGTCRIKPMFCTAYNYSVIPIDNYQYVLEDEPCAF